MAFLFAKLYFLGLGISVAFRKGFFFLEKNCDVIEIIGVDSKICDGMLHLSCFTGKINLFGLNLSGFLESFKNICDVMEIRVEGVFFMIELRCIFWVFA